MQRAVRLALGLSLLVPGVAMAQFQPLSTTKNATTARPKCFMTTSADPSGTKAFDLKSSASSVKTYMENAVMCPSACYDIALSLALKDLSMTMKVTAVNKCAPEQATKEDAQKANRGCDKGQIPPALKVTLLGSAIKLPPIKNRCESAALANISSGSLGSAGAAKDFALQAYAANAASGADLTTVEGQQQTSSVLQAFGVSQEEADTLVKEKPDEAKTLLAALASGDKDTVQEAASSAGVKLNEDTLNNIASLSAEDRAKNFSDLYTADQKQSLDNFLAQSTGFDAERGAGTKITDTVTAFCEQQPILGCGGGCANRPNSLVCQTNNPGAIVCGSIATKFGAIGCSPNNRTAIFPSVEQGAAAMANLLTTSSRYFGNGDKSILQAICGGYAAANCQEYATFVSRQVGVSPMQTIDPKDTATVAKIMTAMSRFENGSGAIFSPQQLQTGLEYAFGTKELPAGTPGYISSLVPGGAPRSGYYAPFALGYGNLYSPYSGYQTPIGQVSTGAPVSTGNPVSTGTVVSTGGVVSTGTPIPTTVATSAGATLNPVATLVAQPKSVFKGNSIAISWSTVGMRSDSPCQVFADQTFIAQGNEGTRSFDTRSVAASTVINFSLQCLPLSGGSKVQQSATVLVK